MASVNCKNETLDNVLVICEEGVSYEGFTHLFDSLDFSVDVCNGDLQDIDVSLYGAVVHLTHSADALVSLLDDRLASIKDEEWVLIAGDSEDLHCTVELTVIASGELKLFIRTLWARFNIS